MKNIIILLVSFLSISSTNLMHDSVSATFNVIKRGHVLMLEIEFDMHDMSHSIGKNNQHHNKITKQEFREYLHKTTSWEFDGEMIIPEVLSLKTIGGHSKAICFLSKAKKNIKSIKIKNEFLLGVKEHSNIIKLDVNNTFKGFRMHKNRKELQVNY